MQNLNVENIQFNNQKKNSYQSVIIIIHWLNFSWSEDLAKTSLMLINQEQYLPYDIKLVCPQSPTITVDLDIEGHPGSKIEPAWYNMISLEDLENGENDRGLIDSIKWIEEIIEKETEKGIFSQNIFIVGISQGGSLALAMAMISKHELGGFVSLAGFVPYQKVLKKIATEKNKKTPIFMVHGQKDKLVPYKYAEKSFRILYENGYQVEPIKNYPELGHEASHFPHMVIDGLIFLRKIFQTKNLPKISFPKHENISIVKFEK